MHRFLKAVRQDSRALGVVAMDEDTLRQVAQIEDLTRDARTVFVGSLVQRADEEWVRKYFEQAGPVEVVRVIRDRHGRSRGHAYVEFTNLDDIPKVLILHGQPMCMTHEGCTCSGFPVVVQPSGAERNYAKSAADDDAALIKTAKRTYIGNVPTGIPESEVRALCSPFGAVVDIRVFPVLEGDERTSFAEVEFETPQMAGTAAEALRGLDLAGHALDTGIVLRKGVVRAMDGRVFDPKYPSRKVLSSREAAAMMTSLAGATHDAAAQLQSTVAAAAMQAAADARKEAARAAAEAEAASIMCPDQSASVPARPDGEPSAALVLWNLIDPGTVANRFFDGDLDFAYHVKRDVIEECERHRDVHYCHVHTAGEQAGSAAVLLEDQQAGVDAANALHGRFYGGRKVGVRFMDREAFLEAYPRATRRLERIKKEAERRRRRREERRRARSERDRGHDRRGGSGGGYDRRGGYSGGGGGGYDRRGGSGGGAAAGGYDRRGGYGGGAGAGGDDRRGGGYGRDEYGRDRERVGDRDRRGGDRRL